MNWDALICGLRESNIAFCLNEPMCRHTSFRIGGNADVFITVASCEELQQVFSLIRRENLPYFCIGRGSDLLVSDDGIEGAVLSLAELNHLSVDGNRITCGAGLSLAGLCTAARDAALTGLEFAYGIPGSVGGALYMNAGAYGGEMADVVASAEIMDETGEIRTLEKAEMDLGYRRSVFQQKPWIITAVTLELNAGERSEISAKMEELLCRRKEKQPLEYPSAGSTFRRPEGYYAGTLIEKNGLKGHAVGDAVVSEKHAGFIINKGSATAKDVLQLIREVQDTVRQQDGVFLQPEVIFVGRKNGVDG